MKAYNCDYRIYISNMSSKDCIIIDPPWSYDDKKMLKTQLNYDLWVNNDKELDFIFKNIKTDHLLMWTTNSFLLNVLKCNHYDFIYKTLVTWVKVYKSGKIGYGLGNTFRNCTEQLVIFTRKKIKPLWLSDRTVIMFEPTQRTEKPKEFEVSIINKLKDKGMKEFAYIFSGPSINHWGDLNIDLIDIVFNENINKFFNF